MLKARFNHNTETIKSYVNNLNADAVANGNQSITVLIDKYMNTKNSPTIVAGAAWDVMRLIGFMCDNGDDSLQSVSEV